MGDRSMSPTTGGRYSPQRSYSKSRSRSPGRGRSYTPDRNDEKVSTIYVGGISFDTDERALQNYFEKWGSVTEAKVVIERETGRSKGYGFVKFADQRDAQDAVTEGHGKLLDGRTIRCNMARYNPGVRGPFGGGGFDGPYSGGGGGRGMGPGPRDFMPYGGRGMGDGGFRGGGRGGPPGGRFGGGPMRQQSGPPFRPMPPNGPPPSGMHWAGSEGRGPESHWAPDQMAPPVNRTRSRSASPRRPHHKRRRSHSPSPVPVAPVEGAPGKVASKKGSKRPSRRQRYSSTASGSSYTSGSSSDSARSRSPRRRRAAAPVTVAPAGAPASKQGTAAAAAAAAPAAAQELVATKRAKAELDTRVAALEAQLQQAHAGRSASDAKIADLQEALEKQAHSNKTFRKWVKSLLESSQALVDGRNQASEIERDNKLRESEHSDLVGQAEAFMAEERRLRQERRSSRRNKDVPAPEATQERAELVEPMAVDMNGALDLPPAPQGDAGGWQNVQDGAALAPAEASNAAARFAPGTKFVVSTA